MTWFSGGEEGGSCRQKSTNEAFRKLIPVNTGVGGGGRRILVYHRVFRGRGGGGSCRQKSKKGIL